MNFGPAHAITGYQQGASKGIPTLSPAKKALSRGPLHSSSREPTKGTPTVAPKDCQLLFCLIGSQSWARVAHHRK